MWTVAVISFSGSKHRHTICFCLYENGWVHLDSPPACSSLLCSIMTWRLTHTALVGFAALPALCWHRRASVTAVKQWPVIADHVLSHPDIAALNNYYHFCLSRALMSIRKLSWSSLCHRTTVFFIFYVAFQLLSMLLTFHWVKNN